jgi:hypothetical protein
MLSLKLNIMITTFIENDVVIWNVTKSFQQKFDLTTFNTRGINMTMFPAYNFIDTENKICFLSIKWQLIIKEFVEYENIFRFKVDYSSLKNVGMEIDIIIIASVTLFMKFFKDNSKIPNASELFEQHGDNRKIHFIRDKIVQRFQDESSSLGNQASKTQEKLKSFYN